MLKNVAVGNVFCFSNACLTMGSLSMTTTLTILYFWLEKLGKKLTVQGIHFCLNEIPKLILLQCPSLQENFTFMVLVKFFRLASKMVCHWE